MKQVYKPFLMLLASLGCLLSCEDKDASPKLSEVAMSVLDPLPFEEIVLTEPADKENPLFATFTWTEFLFYLDGQKTPSPAGPVEYTLEMDVAGNDFEAPHVLAAIRDQLSVNVMVKDVNTALLNMGVEPNVMTKVEIRLAVKYGENMATPVYSNGVLYVDITPYEPSTAIENIYIIGDMEGAWNNTSKEYMMFRNTSDPDDGVYTYTGYIGKLGEPDAECYFKFCPESTLGAWDGMYCAGNGGVLEYGDFGAFMVSKGGYYTLTIDIKEMTWDIITPFDTTGMPKWPQISFVGDFNEWGNTLSTKGGQMTKTAYDPYIWTLTVNVDLVQYGVKFRADDGWVDRWCPTVPTDNPYGIGRHNPTDDPNIDINQQGPGNYFVKFNTLTGHYIVMLQE